MTIESELAKIDAGIAVLAKEIMEFHKRDVKKGISYGLGPLCPYCEITTLRAQVEVLEGAIRPLVNRFSNSRMHSPHRTLDRDDFDTLRQALKPTPNAGEEG